MSVCCYKRTDDYEDEHLFFPVEKPEEPDEKVDGDWTLIEPQQDEESEQKTLLFAQDTEEQPCGHKEEKGCSLDKSRKCCECADKRTVTQSSLYPMYIDGRGWVDNAVRWTYYCPGCKDHRETSILNEVMTRLQKIAAKREVERKLVAETKCDHWLERKCVVATTGKCCACSDLRPVAEDQRYPVYVNGEGWVNGISRWEHYCPGCKEYCATQHDLDTPVETSLVPLNSKTRISIRIGMKRTLLSAENPHQHRQCPHFIRRGCSLTATNGDCCACADKRPRSASGLYKTYIDGYGWVEEGTRWAGYCPNCQIAFDHYFAIMCRSSTKKRQYRLAQQPKLAVRAPPKLWRECEECKATTCSLSIDVCCSCADMRPVAPSYPKYVDGAGWTMGTERWAHYCPGCRDTETL